MECSNREEREQGEESDGVIDHLRDTVVSDLLDCFGFRSLVFVGSVEGVESAVHARAVLNFFAVDRDVEHL